MGLYDTVPLRNDLPGSFEDDGFELTPEMEEKYSRSVIDVSPGQTRERKEYFCKNASIFDVAGRKMTWGDIAPSDVKNMLGVYYILSEHKSFWRPDPDAVTWKVRRSKDPNSKSAFTEFLPEREVVAFDPEHVKKNAIARIVDGEIQTSEALIVRHYS